VEAVCTSATNKGEAVRLVMSHPAATSFAHITVLAINQTNQSRRNTGNASEENAAGIVCQRIRFDRSALRQSNVDVSCARR
jgi:hypothetical protein